jgi:hypothetical protein
MFSGYIETRTLEKSFNYSEAQIDHLQKQTRSLSGIVSFVWTCVLVSVCTYIFQSGANLNASPPPLYLVKAFMLFLLLGYCHAFKILLRDVKNKKKMLYIPFHGCPRNVQPRTSLRI